MRGAAPGERRGGKQAGTPNKITLHRKEEFDKCVHAAILEIGLEKLDAMTPAEYMRAVVFAAARAGLHQAAISVARDAAPYFNPKLSSSILEGVDPKGTVSVKITGGLPDD